MNRYGRWSHILVMVGLAGMVLGALDPLEGAFLILPATGLVALGGYLTESRHRRALAWAFLLVTIGVATLVGLSAVGGFGGDTGRSMWWAILLIPYPVGWLMGLVFGVRRIREGFV
ncbi:MAG TPA: hypothetical protein VFT29_08910 [Gemmatimonadaceae bacterium]|nr:hypothetical protein [Gemmatimonadaceae bacterium]